MKYIIKRYQNKKLYDTKESCFVCLFEIEEMIKDGKQILVFDNKSMKDITEIILLQVLYEREKNKILNKEEGAFCVKTLHEELKKD